MPLLLAVCSVAAQATTKPPAGYAFPPLTGRVVDSADILAAADEKILVAQSERLERSTGHQFVVVTIPSLGGHRIEDYGLRLGNYWGIGRKHINDGVLLIVAPNDRKLRIEVGRGLETVLTNAEAKRIIDIDIFPAFRAGRLPEGIRKGATGIVRELSPALKPVLKKAA